MNVALMCLWHLQLLPKPRMINRFKTYHMHSEKILTIQHWKEVGPSSILAPSSILKENGNTLVIFL